MTPEAPIKDLVVLAADGQMKAAITGILARGPSLQFRAVTTDIYVHPAKDPGCLLRAHDFLRPFCRQYAYALVMLDHDGCGKEGLSRESLEAEIEQRLSASGWQDRAAAIVLDPELEVWVWSDSAEVDAALGWSGRDPGLRAWLTAQGHLLAGQTKPQQPKKALEHALRIARKGRSSAIYLQLAQRVSIHRCTDPAFLKFKTTLQSWFGGDL